MIPTSTGAAKAVALVLPELEGKLDGSAIRVPTPNVSCIDLKFLTEKSVSVAEINAEMQKASKGKLKGVLGFENRSLVSIDFNHWPASSTLASQETKVLPSGMARILSWYDNEWGFSNRMADTAVKIGSLI
jgi:glyceraldehyde 3-phosphate dehydrogenase